jgi:hypothetical protein
LVGELFESIKYTENVLDKPGKNGRPAQAVRRIRDGFYVGRSGIGQPLSIAEQQALLVATPRIRPIRQPMELPSAPAFRSEVDVNREKIDLAIAQQRHKIEAQTVASQGRATGKRSRAAQSTNDPNEILERYSSARDRSRVF